MTAASVTPCARFAARPRWGKLFVARAETVAARDERLPAVACFS
jgi:hypothetical protein